MSAPTLAPPLQTTAPLAEPSTAPTLQAAVEEPELPGPVPCTQLAPVPCTQLAKKLSDDENWAMMMSPLIEHFGRQRP